MRDELIVEFEQMGLPTDTLEFTYTADMRFVGQAFELGVELPGDRLKSLTVKDFNDGFEEAHYRMFYHGVGSNRPIEIVSFRVGATYPVGEIPDMQSTGDGGHSLTEHPVFDGGKWIDCQHMASQSLKTGELINKPTIIEGSTATTFVTSGWQAELDDASNLIMKRS